VRRCGKRYTAPEDAWRSKAGQRPDAEVTDCRAGCGGFHVVKPPRPPRARRRPKDTGPSQKVRGLVLARDNFQCAGCGKPVGGACTWWSLQHRKARGSGGDNSPCNLIVLCGSATSPGCHRLCEDRDREMHARGLWLRGDEDPAMVPVMIASEYGSGITVWLAGDGIGPDGDGYLRQRPALGRAA